MANTYAISIVGNPLGNATTGVIEQVAWRMEGTDGTNVSVLSGVAVLPAIDPTSPTFIPLPQITVPVLLQWAASLLNLPNLKSTIDGNLTAQAQAIAAQPATAPLAPLQLAPPVAAQAMAGVPV